MRETVKRTAVTVLAGALAAGMLTGCGEKTLDGAKTVATVNGTEIPLGVVSLMARYQQAQTDYMYKMMGGSAAEIWDTVADEESGETYGQQAVSELMDQVELMYLMKEKAADYGVELTEEDQSAIAEAAAAFMADNSEETIKELAVTEDQVKTYLELQTYQSRIHDPIVADVDTEVSDEEAQQSSFSYVSVGISSLSEEEIDEKQKQAQEILDKLLEDPSADMEEVAKETDDSLYSYEGHFTTNVGDEEESSSYPDELISALRETEEGEMVPELVTTDSAYYIARLDSVFDEEATESEKESIVEERKDTLYSETTEQWVEDADITVNEKVLKTLTLTDSHSFVFPTAAPEPETEDAAEDETAVEEEDASDEETAAEEDASDEEAAAEEDASDEETAAEEDASDEEAAAETEDTSDEEAPAEETPEEETSSDSVTGETETPEDAAEETEE